MQPTSSNRREIAASLRESRDYISGLPYVSLEQNAFKTFERILECVGYEGGNIFDYLADLIDPTCHVVGTISMDWSDGSTVYVHRMSCGHTRETSLPEPPEYCDECGARVVSGDAD